MFAYCGNNPANCFDPAGYTCIFENDRRYYGNGCVEYTDARTGNPGMQIQTPDIMSLPMDITQGFDEIMGEHLAELSLFYQSSYTYYLGLSFGDEQFSRQIAKDDAIAYFITKVETNGDWDLKNGDYFVAHRNFLYRGQIFTGEDLGNIHFGYVGAFLFPKGVLHLGAGVYQLISGTKSQYWPTYFDSPRDYDMVEYGWRLYHEGQ